MSANLTTAERLPMALAAFEGPIAVAAQEARCHLQARGRLAAAVSSASAQVLWHGDSGYVGAAVRGAAARLRPLTLPERLGPRAAHLLCFRDRPLHAFSIYASADGTAAAASDCSAILVAVMEAAAVPSAEA